MNAHVEIGQLAAFAEGGLGGPEAVSIREHLAGCRSCMAAYADTVRYRAAWLVNAPAFDADGEFRGLALHPEQREERGRGSRGARRPLALLVAAVVIVVAVAGLGLLRPWTTANVATLALPPAVLEATQRSSMRGLVLPGATAGGEGTFPELRGGPQVTLELRREVDVLVGQYERGSRGPVASAQVIAALLGAGEIDAAGDYAREALFAHPDNVPLLLLAADVRYRANDVAGAEALLRRARARAPRDPLVALDLGLVLAQRGRESEARALLEQAARAPTPGIAARARRELSQLRSFPEAHR